MDFGYEITTFVATMDRHAGAMLAPLGVTYGQFQVLFILASNPGASGRQLADLLALSAPAVSKTVRRLLEVGFIEDTAPARSGNVRRLHLTRVGGELLDECLTMLTGVLDGIARRTGVDVEHLARQIHLLHEDARRLERQARPVLQSPEPSAT